MDAIIRRLCAPSPVPVRLTNPYPRSNHRGFFSGRRLLEGTKPGTALKVKLAYRQTVTIMARLSVKSRAKASLLAEYEMGLASVRRSNELVGSTPLERWTMGKMKLPSVTALAIEEKRPLVEGKERIGQTAAAAAAAGRLVDGRRVSPSFAGFTNAHRSSARSSLLRCSPSPTWDAPRRQVRSDVSVRHHSTIIEKRMQALADRIPEDTLPIDLKQIMEDLRDLELLEKLKKATAKSATGFKDASRALYPLWHEVDQDKKKKVTFAELQEALPAIMSVPWTHITQRLVENKVHKLDSLNAKERAALLFLRVYNIGEARAQTFVAAGARTLEDLERLGEQKKISWTKGHKIGLKHLDDIERLIPRAEMEKLKSALEAAIHEADPTFECEILGSYRRQATFSSDIDLAVRHKSFIGKNDEETADQLMEAIVSVLEGHKLLLKENQLMLGPKKYAGLIRLSRHKHFRRIDIRLSPYHSYPYQLLGCSGDALLMKLLRHTAKQKGMTLNEYGMGKKHTAADQNPNGFKAGTMKIVKDEKEIFDLLGFPYLKPEERDYAIWRPKYEAAGVDVSYIHKL